MIMVGFTAERYRTRPVSITIVRQTHDEVRLIVSGAVMRWVHRRGTAGKEQTHQVDSGGAGLEGRISSQEILAEASSVKQPVQETLMGID
jgi:hypothetical protein